MRSIENIPQPIVMLAVGAAIGASALTGCKDTKEATPALSSASQLPPSYDPAKDVARTALADRYDSCTLQVEDTPHHAKGPVSFRLTLNMKPEARPVFEKYKEDDSVEWTNVGITTRMIYGGDQTTYDRHIGMYKDTLSGGKDSTEADEKAIYDGNLVKGTVMPSQQTYPEGTQVFFYKDASTYSNDTTNFSNVYCGAMQYNTVNGVPTWHQVAIPEPEQLPECSKPGYLLPKSYDVAPGLPCSEQ